MSIKYKMPLITILFFLLVILLSSCALQQAPDKTDATSPGTSVADSESDSQQTLDSTELTLPSTPANDLVLSLSKDNMLKTINEISQMPRPINSERINEVELYLINSFKNFGYDYIESQMFEYNDEKNEYAIRRSHQLDIYLAPTAENTKVDGIGTNIIVTKAAQNSTKNTLIISAHYDSTIDSNGANDNGSGVAIVLELARILENISLPYNVKFIMFSGEEKFMLGSRNYVNSLSEEEKQNIIGLINIDSVAEKSNLGYLVMLYGNKKIANMESTPEDFVKLAKLNENNISNLLVDNDRFVLTMAINSDHYPFSLVSIPAVSIVQDWQEGLNANSSQDTIEHIDDNRLIEVASHVIQAFYNISP